MNGYRHTLYFGWIIVIACTLIMMITAGIMYSYGVLFKNLIAAFEWSRAATSGVHSVFMLTNGACGLLMGILADRLGPRKVLVTCGFIVGAALILTSQINVLWQLYISYGVLLGIGLSANFTIATATTARWFTKRRGVALGIVSSGAGVGTFFIIPATERLIASFGWSKAYLILGLISSVVIVSAGLLLKNRVNEIEPEREHEPHTDPTASIERHNKGDAAFASDHGISLTSALRHKHIWMLSSAYFLILFSLQIVMIHLINYATDIGIASLIAATFISIIGLSGFFGRLIMGTISDRIGGTNALLICCAIIFVSLLFIVFASNPWMFYIFAVVFGFAYGGEIPQMASIIGQYYGVKAVGALVGLVTCGATAGGAIGAWLAGQIFDMTQSYLLAFTFAAAAVLIACVLTILLGKMKPLV